jgi:hypothetical protein
MYKKTKFFVPTQSYLILTKKDITHRKLDISKGLYSPAVKLDGQICSHTVCRIKASTQVSAQ